MINQMTIEGRKAVISFDPEIGLFRGEFTGLTGGADFYAADVESLKREGAISLRVYLDDCRAKGREPYAKASGTLMLRVPPEVHVAVTAAAKATGKSVNQWAAQVLRDAAHI